MTCHCGSPQRHAERAEERAREDARFAEERAAQQIKAQKEVADRRYAELAARTPNPDEFEIEDVEQVGKHLVMRVKYPSCSKCAWEGLKTMVIPNATLKEAIKWKRIDPHFRKGKSDPKEAPSPIARFPGSVEDLKMAIEWAKWIQNARHGE